LSFRYLLDKNYYVGLINPTVTDIQKTHRRHNLKEELNKLKRHLQKSVNAVFEDNSLFNIKYGTIYTNILKQLPSAKVISNTDIKTLKKYFRLKGKGNRIILTVDTSKEAVKNSIGFPSIAEEINIKNLVFQIELITPQIKGIEEFSVKTNSPILSIPGISRFSSTSILAKIGGISNFNKVSQLIKFAGVSLREYESSQLKAQHTIITNKGPKHRRETLYQITLVVIKYNSTFYKYYKLKTSQGKSRRCAQGHYARKLLRIIYRILKTNQTFDPALLK